MFAQELKELNIKSVAVFFCFLTVLQSYFIPISRMPWIFPISPLREEPLLMRTECSEAGKQKSTLFKFRRG